MDSSSLNPFFLILLLILFVGIRAYFRSAGFKGAVGEWQTKTAGKLRLPEHAYHQYHDLVIPTNHGLTQIDHVILSKHGIFVVETKNYTGWIFGSPQQAKWTQKIYKETFRFQNPLRQNYKHTKAVSSLLNLPDTVVHSVIVFTGDCIFKTPMPENVTTIGKYTKYIKGFTAEVLTKKQIAVAKAALDKAKTNSTKKAKSAHVRQLKVRPNKKTIVVDKCPRCGSQLVMRTAKKGSNAGRDFWGCSAFPRCRYIKNV